MEKYDWIFSLPSSIAIGLVGMMMHFFKKKITGEALTDIVNYFMSNFKSTVIAIISTMVTVVATHLTLATGSPIDIVTIFGLGYMCDSAFNKFENI
jgi:multidrug efflux pump subunit AcrB